MTPRPTTKTAVPVGQPAREVKSALQESAPAQASKSFVATHASTHKPTSRTVASAPMLAKQASFAQKGSAPTHAVQEKPSAAPAASKQTPTPNTAANVITPAEPTKLATAVSVNAAVAKHCAEAPV